MLELTEQQAHAVESSGAAWPRLVNPRTQETYVLLRAEEYERLKASEYDDSPWRREELEAAAWAVAEGESWDEYDAPVKP